MPVPGATCYPPPVRRSSPLALVTLLLLLLVPAAGAADSAGERRRLMLRGVPETIAGEYADVRTAMLEGKYGDADRETRAFLADVERRFGAESLEAALALDLVVENLVRGGERAEDGTRDLAERALRIKRATAGPASPLTARTLQLLGWIERDRDHRDEAEKHLREAVGIVEAAYGPDDPDVAVGMNDLGNLTMDAGRLEESRTYYARTLDILRKNHGDDDPGVGVVLNNLALVEEQLANFDEARRLHLRALELRRKGHGPHHPEVAQSLSNLAILEVVSGNLALGIRYFREALDVFEHALPPGHPTLAQNYTNLALTLVEAGDLREARALLEKSLAIHERHFGREHTTTAHTLFSLGSLHRELGDPEAADAAFRETLRIRRAVLPADHPEVARTVSALGQVALELGRPAEASERLAEALGMFERSLGVEHPEYAACLERAGAAARDAGDPAKAEMMQLAALNLRGKLLPPGHADLGMNLGELGVTLQRVGRAAEAVPMHERALAIKREALGPRHPEVARELVRLSDALSAVGQREDALAAAWDAEEVGRAYAAMTAQGLSEREALRFVSQRETGLSRALALTADPSRTVEDVRTTWDALVRSRALVLDEMARRHRMAVREGGGALAAEVDSLALARRRLANLARRGPGDETAEQYRRLVDEARGEKEARERRLAERSAVFRESAGPDAGLAEVRRALPEGAALVAYARTDAGDDPSYLAFVLPGRDADPVLRRLGSAERIETAVGGWHELCGAASAARGILRETPASPPDAAEIAARGAEVRALLWDAVRGDVAGASLVFLVPDGAVHLVCFDVLPEDGGAFLAETAPLLHYLSAERDIVSAGAHAAAVGRGFLAVGGPDFDRGASSRRAVPVSGAPLWGLRGEHGDCAQLPELRFPQLAWAADEVQDVAGTWKRGAARGKVERLVGAEATEAAVKRRAPGHEVLHFATHAYVLGEGCASPLLRAGLALAGANRRDTAAGGEDGILTAEEIASLDLSGTRWVVLSACATGLGEIRTGEGILGLRRAFEVSGAGTLLGSLWDVNDRTAREWMHQLYRARFVEKRATPDAMRAANRALLREARAAGDTSPAAWGGFVAAGDWR